MRRTITIAIAGLTALVLAGCSASDPEEENTSVPEPTTASSPSAEEAAPDKDDDEEGEATLGESPSEEGMTEENMETLDESADEMFLEVTESIGSSVNLSEEERIAIGKEACIKIESEDMSFESLASWAKKEGGLPEGSGLVLVSAAINTYCPDKSDMIS